MSSLLRVSRRGIAVALTSRDADGFSAFGSGCVSARSTVRAPPEPPDVAVRRIPVAGFARSPVASFDRARRPRRWWLSRPTLASGHPSALRCACGVALTIRSSPLHRRRRRANVVCGPSWRHLGRPLCGGLVRPPGRHEQIRHDPRQRLVELRARAGRIHADLLCIRALNAITSVLRKILTPVTVRIDGSRPASASRRT